MFGWIAAAVASLLLLTNGPNTPDWTKIYERVTPSILTLSSDEESEDVGCTAVVVAPDLVVTAEHCVDSDQDFFTPYGQLGPEFAQMGEVIAFVQETDRPALELRRAPLKPGERVAALGHARGIESPLIMPGIVQPPSKVLDERMRRWVQDRLPILWHTSDLHAGMSGGPVVDSDGKFVSINWFYTVHRRNEVLMGSPDNAHLVMLVDALRLHGFDAWPYKGDV